MKVKLKCGHTVEVELHGEKICPKKCKGTFKCPVCKSVECDCKKNAVTRIEEINTPHLSGSTFEWDKKHYSNNAEYLDGGEYHKKCTEEHLINNKYRYDMICANCGLSYGSHHCDRERCPVYKPRE